MRKLSDDEPHRIKINQSPKVAKMIKNIKLMKPLV